MEKMIMQFVRRSNGQNVGLLVARKSTDGNEVINSAIRDAVRKR